MPSSLPFRLPKRTYENSRSSDSRAITLTAPTNLCDLCSKPALSLVPRRNEWLCASCFPTRPASAQEITHRVNRAYALADVLGECGGDPEAAVAMTEAEWEMAARAANITLPSIETRAKAVRVLCQRAERKAAAHA